MFRQSLVVLAATFVALLVVAAAMGAVAAVGAATSARPIFQPIDAAVITFAYTVIFGTLPALLVGAPAYLLLWRKGFARWPCVLGLGVAPGVIVMAVNPNLGFWAAICGGLVSLLTHAACRRVAHRISRPATPVVGT